MLTIKSPSDKPCFICGVSSETVQVKFQDHSFAGVLCMKHIYEKVKPKGSARAESKDSGGKT